MILIRLFTGLQQQITEMKNRLLIFRIQVFDEAVRG